jgi:hypothetical protein
MVEESIFYTKISSHWRSFVLLSSDDLFLRVDDQVEVETCFFSREKFKVMSGRVVVVRHRCTKWTQKPQLSLLFHTFSHKVGNMHALLWCWCILKLQTRIYFFTLIYSYRSWASWYTPPPITPPTPKTPKGDLKCATRGIPNTLKNLANIQIRLTTSKMEN